jgi:hypothetical protein
MMAALVAVAVPAGASAQPARPQSHVDAVIRCLDVAAIEERVACYDRAARSLRDGVQRGEVVTKPAPTPSRVQARVASASVSAGRWEIVLDNGQKWRTWERKEDGPPAAGTPVRIERNLIGSYWMRVPGGGQARVDRVQ